MSRKATLACVLQFPPFVEERCRRIRPSQSNLGRRPCADDCFFKKTTTNEKQNTPQNTTNNKQKRKGKERRKIRHKVKQANTQTNNKKVIVRLLLSLSDKATTTHKMASKKKGNKAQDVSLHTYFSLHPPRASCSFVALVSRLCNSTFGTHVTGRFDDRRRAAGPHFG